MSLDMPKTHLDVIFRCFAGARLSQCSHCVILADQPLVELLLARILCVLA